MAQTLKNIQETDRSPVAVEYPGRQKRVIIVGAGFAGLAAARALAKCSVEIVLIDRRNHHIFQPLLYQVATAVLSSSEIAAPIRQLTQKQKNLSVIWGEVKRIDTRNRFVELDCPSPRLNKMSFDYLVIATGVQPSYFGHDEFARYAPTLKTIADAELIRSKLLGAYELAEMTDEADERERQLTIVLVGGGPTGVELAASMAQLATVTLRSNFRKFDPAETSILLIEGGERVLPSYDKELSRAAAERLEKLGVTVMTNSVVQRVDDSGVTVNGKSIKSATVVWTAGVAASPIVKMLGGPVDRAGRASVGPFMNIPNTQGVFVVGDASSSLHDARPIPGVAQAAIQQGRYVGHFIATELRGAPPPKPFRYADKGSMAVIGKNFAIMETGRIRLSGFVAWLAWAFVHFVSLPQRQNRRRVRSQWLWSYFTGQRSSRIISEAPRASREPR